MADYTSYKPGSDANENPGESKKKVEKVVKGDVKRAKKSGIRKFTDIFISEDLGKVKDYVIYDLIVPGAKRLFVETIENAANMAILGDHRDYYSDSGVHRTSYSSYYDDIRGSDVLVQSPHSRGYDNLVLTSKKEAEDVLRSMDRLIKQYGVVSVSDLYDLVGLVGDYTDCKYGWKSIQRAKIVTVRNGYLLKFPPAMPFD